MTWMSATSQRLSNGCDTKPVFAAASAALHACIAAFCSGLLPHQPVTNVRIDDGVESTWKAETHPDADRLLASLESMVPPQMSGKDTAVAAAQVSHPRKRDRTSSRMSHDLAKLGECLPRGADGRGTFDWRSAAR